ncbi:hypothetical protein EVG20_g8312 [Dentipellis fragilis]|uniref:Uncharacterized protein n=1 Tax=Dentipellis fragilis TaxID=205917 RepID=A0A4Y9Y757_9AGAM|nr:hypothetical protein EVG20_g8312 [Dentipellis fragilis]
MLGRLGTGKRRGKEDGKRRWKECNEEEGKYVYEDGEGRNERVKGTRTHDGVTQNEACYARKCSSPGKDRNDDNVRERYNVYEGNEGRKERVQEHAHTRWRRRIYSPQALRGMRQQGEQKVAHEVDLGVIHLNHSIARDYFALLYWTPAVRMPASTVGTPSISPKKYARTDAGRPGGGE